MGACCSKEETKAFDDKEHGKELKVEVDTRVG